jgi:tRNA(Arg) A34 adenosine deaminase TadA
MSQDFEHNTQDNTQDNIQLDSIHHHWMQLAIAESQAALRLGEGGPFGAVIVRGNQVIAAGHNQVLRTSDPTAHAEIVVIRQACQVLQSFNLAGCTLYSSCEPCPMCLGAIYWARLDSLYYANSRGDAAAIDFDDEWIYTEIAQAPADRHIPMIHLSCPEALEPFRVWQGLEHKTPY